MLDQEIDINREIVKRFALLNKRERLAHAYLFIGPVHCGKGETALEIAKFLNCEQNTKRDKEAPCGKCPSCVKIASANHPDIHVIDNGYEDSIKIEQIRGLLERIKLRSFFDQKKIFIIKNVENMTLESGNALLKTLEEPSKDSILILTTSSPEKNLQTVRSRCHSVYFYPDTDQSLEDQLVKQYKESRLSAHFLAYFAQGCLGKAKNLKQNNLFKEKNKVIDQFIYTYDNDAFVKKVLAEKDKTKQLLEVLLSWVRDAILIQSGVEDVRLVHLDRIKDLKDFSKGFSFEELTELNNEVINACQLFTDNLNIKIPLLIIKERLWAR